MINMKMIPNLTERLGAYESEVNGDRQRELQLHLTRGFTTYTEGLAREDYTELCQKFPELQPVQDFWDRLSPRARKALLRSGVKTIADLADYTRKDFKKAQRPSGQFHGAGENTLDEIKEVLLVPYELDYKSKEPAKSESQRH